MQQGPELCYKAGRSENWQTVDDITISFSWAEKGFTNSEQGCDS